MRVFSTEKYINDAKARNKTLGDTMLNVMAWGIKCEGLTEEEMGAKGYLTSKEWMEEVDDNLVFSVEAWMEDIKSTNIPEDKISGPLDIRVKECEGLSMAEMRERGFMFQIKWFIPSADWGATRKVGGVN